MSLTDFFKRTLIVVIGVTLSVVLVTSIMGFMGVPPMSFNPYMFFLIAIGVLALFLSPRPLSIVD